VRRVRSLALSTALVAVAIVPLAASAGEASTRDDAADTTTTVQKENRRGTLVCQAQFADTVLIPGRPIEVSLFVKNVSHRVQYVGKRGALVIRPLGQHEDVWSSGAAAGPLPPERRLGPGNTDRIDSGVTTRVRWSGPLKIRPVCPGTGINMGWTLFDVAVPTPPASTSDAIAAAVTMPGSPWASCHPGPSGEVATGTLTPLEGAGLEPLTVRCSADVRHEEGFDVVGFSMISPVDAPGYVIPEPTNVEEAFSAGGELPGSGAMFVLRWVAVVSADEIRPVLFQSRTRTVGSGEYPTYALRGGTWSRLWTSACGSASASFEPTGRSLWIDWYTACDE
jgi:hypothetical protein